MTKREKIIVSIMSVTVVIGALNFVLPSGRQGTAAATKSQPLNSTVVQVEGQMEQSRLTERERYALELATVEWEPGLFQIQSAAISASPPQEYQPPPADFSLPAYQAYVKIGDREMAILDGRGYRVGDRLENGGFLVTGIYPHHIELRRNNETLPERLELEPENPERN